MMKRATREETTVLNIAGILGIKDIEWVRDVYHSCGRNENKAFYRLEQVRLAVDVQAGIGCQRYIALCFSWPCRKACINAARGPVWSHVVRWRD
jgi:hypothetical protein